VAWSYEIDEAAGLIRFRLYGLVSDTDLFDADQSMRKDPLFRPELNQIVDMTAAEEGDLTTGKIREVATGPPIFSRESRRAIVVRGDLGFGLARVFQARRGEVAGEIEVFRSLADAEAWVSG
jgi:hypothetical protein